MLYSRKFLNFNIIPIFWQLFPPTPKGRPISLPAAVSHFQAHLHRPGSQSAAAAQSEQLPSTLQHCWGDFRFYRPASNVRSPQLGCRIKPPPLLLIFLSYAAEELFALSGCPERIDWPSDVLPVGQDLPPSDQETFALHRAQVELAEGRVRHGEGESVGGPVGRWSCGYCECELLRLVVLFFTFNGKSFYNVNIEMWHIFKL